MEAITARSFPRDANSPARGRRLLEDVALPGAVLADAQLLLTEVLSNAVIHGSGGGASLEVSVAADETTLRVTVTDRGRPGFARPAPPRPDVAATSGWGLYLLDRVAARWDLDDTGGEMSIWFELALDSSRDDV